MSGFAADATIIDRLFSVIGCKDFAVVVMRPDILAEYRATLTPSWRCPNVNPPRLLGKPIRTDSRMKARFRVVWQ